MADIETKIALLEDNHNDLKTELRHTAQSLSDRIDATDQALQSMRSDMNTGLQNVQSALNGVATGALKSWPPEAMQALKEANEERNRDASTKGVFIGAIVSLLGLIVALVIAMTKHMVS